MKFTFVVNQTGVVDAGLLGKVSVEDLCLLHHLHGWFNFPGAKTEKVEGQKFVWLHFARAIEELPLLLNPQAKLTSRKNQLSGMIERLRVAGLVETSRHGRRLFFRLTDLAVRIKKRHDRLVPTSTKPASVVTPSHDDTVTRRQDRTITSLRDEYLPTIIDETGTSESKGNESPPVSPCEGEAQSIHSLWNSFPELLPIKTLTQSRARNIRKRLADSFWREHWRQGIERIAKSNFAKGGGANRWRATLDWFLGPNTLVKILEGQYDNRPQKLVAQASVLALQVQLKAIEIRLKEHPANTENNGGHYGGITQAECDEYRELRRSRKQLLNQISNGGVA